MTTIYDNVPLDSSGGLDYSADKWMETDFDHSQIRGEEQTDVSLAKEFFHHLAPDDIKAEIEAEAYHGVRLGNSRTILKAVAQAARTVQRRLEQVGGHEPGSLDFNMGVSSDQMRALKSEAIAELKKAFMQGKAEWIRRSRMSLPG